MSDRDPFDHRSGPRFSHPPTGPECWRCAEPASRYGSGGRLLRLVGITVDGHHIGTVLLCHPCIEARTPLNPDPLRAEDAA